jgi:hypothetical protein
MSASSHQWPYWSVDLPGLTESGAQRVVAVAAHEQLSTSGFTVNPEDAFSIHMDQDTIDAVVEALRVAVATGALSAEEDGIVRGFLELLTEWLSR